MEYAIKYINWGVIVNRQEWLDRILLYLEFDIKFQIQFDGDCYVMKVDRKV